MKDILKRNQIAHFMGVSVLALSLSLSTMPVAFAVSPATLDNTATATGDSPTGTDDVTDSDSVEVDLLDPIDELLISKAAALTTDADTDLLGDEADVITYTYTITNNGNTTLTAVGVDDTHDGSATLTTPTFSSWTTQAGSPAVVGTPTTIEMAPGAVAVFTTTYAITAADILASGGGATADNDIDNSAIAEGTSPGGTAGDITSTPSVASIPLDITSSLDVAKAAYEAGVPADIAATGLGGATASAGDHAAGETITYVYAVTNDGDVPVSNIDVSDVHSGLGTLSAVTFNSLDNVSGNSSGAGNPFTELYPGDTAYFTATYVVTQGDIDAQ